MTRRCELSGKLPMSGNNVSHAENKVRRKFRPNLQKIRIRMPNGGTKRVWVSVKAIKAGLVQKA